VVIEFILMNSHTPLEETMAKNPVRFQQAFEAWAAQASDASPSTIGISTISAMHYLLLVAHAAGVRTNIEGFNYPIVSDQESELCHAIEQFGFMRSSENNSVSSEEIEDLLPAALDCIAKALKATGKELNYKITEIK
jgi:hypothetical protein